MANSEGSTPELNAGPRTYVEVLAAAIAALTEATRLTNQPGRRTPEGRWELDPDATAQPIDWAAFVTKALAGATANAGGIDKVLAGRPGSWEASRIRDTLISTVGHDEHDLMRHRTEPVHVVLNPAQILYDISDSAHMHGYDEAEQEICRREVEVSAPISVTVKGGPDYEARVRAEFDKLPPVSEAEHEAIEDALQSLSKLRERLQAQERAELATYGESLAAAVTDGLAALNLPVPVSVSVDLDTELDGWHGGGTPLVGEVTGFIDVAIADAIMLTPSPSNLPGTPLQRAEGTSGDVGDG